MNAAEEDSGQQLVKLNVGGTIFVTNAKTLNFEPGSLLGALCAQGGGGGVQFLDRDPTSFRHILNYLRTGQLVLPDQYPDIELLRHEAYHFKLYGLVGLIENRMNDSRLLRPKLVLQVTFDSVNQWLREVTMPAVLVPLLMCRSSQQCGSSIKSPGGRFNSSLLSNVTMVFFVGARRAILSTELDAFKQVSHYIRKRCQTQKGYYCNQLLLFTDVYTRQRLVDNLDLLDASPCNLEEGQQPRSSVEKWLVSI